MQRQRNSIFLQEAYSEDNGQANDWDLFLYESMIEHSYTPDNTALILLAMGLIDAFILDELGDDISSKDKRKLPKTSQIYLDNGLPRDSTILQGMYNQFYYHLALPWYKSNYTDPYIPLDYDTRSVIEQSAKLQATNETNHAFDYFTKCRDYVAMQNVVIDSHEYIKSVVEKPSIQRITPISQNIKSGTLVGETSKPKINFHLHMEDANIYLKNVSEFESRIYANSRHYILGQEVPYSHKTWLWSHNRRTRHSFMEGQTVLINEPFVVTNERTGEVSNLMFPRDYARDPSGANTINCGCEVHYHNNKKVMSNG